MSTNDPARPLSRRLLLSAGTAAAMLPGAAAALTIEGPVDALFRRWLAQSAHYNGPALGDADDDVLDPYFRAIQATEQAITDQPASLATAAAALMVEITYREPGHETPRTLRDRGIDDPVRIGVHVLEGLRPHLTGFIGAMVADIVDHPDRPLGESRLFTIRRGREA